MHKAVEVWRRIRASRRFHNISLFAGFSVLAFLFWFILALNDNIQEDLKVRLNIYNVPDSVTFIDIPPSELHVNVRDKGTNLWRNGVFGNPQINVNFRDYAGERIFRMSRNEMTAQLKNIFGQSAQIISVSRDSLRLLYTTYPGKRVPVEVDGDFTAAAGKIIVARPQVEPKNVVVYGFPAQLDTLTRVFTERVSAHGLEESGQFTTQLRGIPSCRIMPEVVKVGIKVETLVRKKSTITVKSENVPEGYELLLFPSRVEVEYYVPMSDFSSQGDSRSERLDVTVDYREVTADRKRLPLHLGHYPRRIVNPILLTDSVEYTLMRE